MKHIYLLGSTGSIGKQTLDIIRKHKDEFKLIAISGYSQYEELLKITKEFSPKMVVLKDQESALKFSYVFPDVMVDYGKNGLKKLASFNKEDKNAYLINALVGMVGLEPTIEAIKIERDILLANKETLVVGGHLINDLKKEYSFKLYPIDSEHNALWQLLYHEKKDHIKRLIITASGGSFRDLSREDLENVSIDQALNHPNWSMGSKITIDSATMMNKGFEVIEACYLFDIDIEKVDTFVHRESLVHSMVEFIDGSIVAHFSEPDMHLPIAYAMFYPSRVETNIKALDIMKMNQLTFEEMDEDRYPCLALAKDAYKKGGSMRTVLNAANEAAVDLFLHKEIQFLDIEKIIREMMDEHHVIDHPSLEEIYQIDALVKKKIYQKYR